MTKTMRNTKKGTTVSEIVTERIMDMLKEGTIPWHKPWTGVRGGACSHVSGRPYSLLNQMLLWKPGEYLTKNQAKKEGGAVREGEKPGIIVFWKQIEREIEEEDGQKKRVAYPKLIYYRVYHIDQCEGIAAKYDPENLPPFEVNAEAERIIRSYTGRSGCQIKTAQSDRACYYPSHDTILMPLREQFDDEEGFYATLFHEIGHSTGHSSRLNRFTSSSFGDEPYSKEELVAELVSASVMNMLGLETARTVKNAAAYIQSWLHALKDDMEMIVWAAGRAAKALGIITEDVAVTAVAGSAAEEDEAAASTKPTVKKPAPTPKSATASAFSMQKAAERFAKANEKAMKDTRPNLAGAFMHEDRQFISNGYVLAVYDVPFEGLPQADTTQGCMGSQFEGYLQTARVGNIQALPDLDTTRKQYKVAKAGKRGYKQFTKLGDMYINTQYLIQAMELAGVSGGTANVQEKQKPLYIKGDGCEVIVLPVIASSVMSTDTWEPELSA